MYILGISAFYHDSAAALLRDGEVIAAAQEERFTRKKHDASFPINAILYCLKEAGIGLHDVADVVFYDKPLLKFERLLETYIAYSPKGLKSFLAAMPVWLKEKLFLKQTLRSELRKLLGGGRENVPNLLFAEHHQSHAASAFFPSPFERAAVLCLDGVGEWATSTVWHGTGRDLTLKWEIDFPHSLGLFYSAFTYYCGFKVNSGEYKLMGLAPYGKPRFVQTILDNLIDLKPDGTFRLNMDYFAFATGLTMTNSRFDGLFGGPSRKAESPITERELDIARSVQFITEEVVLRLARTIYAELREKNLCLAGGVALNCVANGRLMREGPFENIWIQPAAGDAGGALGAACSAWYQHHKKPRKVGKNDQMKGSYLGPSVCKNEISTYFDSVGAQYEVLSDDVLFAKAAELLDRKMVIGWVQGRMEFGPRALGARSIIGDPRCSEMQRTMNIKIKFRESFRPFAPAVLAEDASLYFDIEKPSPYMLITAPVKEERRFSLTFEQEQLEGLQRLDIRRSEIPAVTHIDYSARIQTVHEDTNPRFYKLLNAFKERTGCSTIVNTSFNVRGEPIVCSVEDAYRCFMRTNMDYLIVENHILSKHAQPAWQDGTRWEVEFELD